MNRLNTTQLDLQKNGWSLLVNENALLKPSIGDLAKIELEILSPLDFDKQTISSVSHEPLWIEIAEIQADGLSGILKTLPTHDLELKDGTKFALGDQIFIREKNILAIR